MSEFYGDRNDDESAATIRRALDLGINFLDTADTYGIGDNEELIGKTIRGRRDDVFIATKFANIRKKDDPTSRSQRFPRFANENFDKNHVLVERVRAIATRRGVTPGQLALAWVLAKGKDLW